MIWNILSGKSTVVEVPRKFNRKTAYNFINSVIDEDCDARFSKLTIDFSRLDFIEPVGVVVLSNLIEYLKKSGVRVTCRVPESRRDGINYLDDSQFFTRYAGEAVRSGARLRDTTIPLELVTSERTQEYLFFKLMPWIERNLGLSEGSLATIRTCIDEIFSNVKDHSSVKIGCAFAQHYPNKNQIHIAISDFGLGIPNVVRRKVPTADDTKAISLACTEGFTTQSNVRNRGAGLPNLIRYVTLRNQGTVLIASGKGVYSALYEDGKTKATARSARGSYPGTLVHTILKTDRFAAVAADAQPEAFEW